MHAYQVSSPMRATVTKFEEKCLKLYIQYIVVIEEYIIVLTLNQPRTHNCVQSLHMSIRIYMGS